MDLGWLLGRCWVDFGTNLDAKLEQSWHQLGSQNPPKMEPSWIQNRGKLEHGLRTYFLKDVGLIFYDFGTHVKTAEVAKTIEEL